MTGLEKYKRALFSCLSCPAEEKEFFFSHICQSAQAESQEKLSYEELISVFGAPETVAASYMDQRPAENSLTEVTTIKKRARQFNFFVSAVVVFIIGLIIFFCIWDRKTRTGTITVGPPNIESIETDNSSTEGGLIP